MKNFFNSICSFIKAHTAVVISSAAVVAAVGVGIGAIAIARNHRSGPNPLPDTPPIADAAGHVHVYTKEDVLATCTHGAYTLYSCDCGFFYKAGEGTPLSHEFGDWHVLQDATMDNSGEKEQRCLRCNTRNTEIIPKIEEHEHVYTDEVVQASCNEDGYTVHTCTVCGFKVADTETRAFGHTWSAWRTTKEASSDCVGEKVRACQTCGATETSTIPKPTNEGHKHSYTSTVVTATCTSGGYTRHTCACGSTYDSDKTSKRSHLYGNWKTTIQPTASSPGEKTCVCAHCGHALKESIPALAPETTVKYDNFIDSRIEVKTLPDGAIRYYYYPVDVIDTRSWGDPPTIRITDNGGFLVSYFKQNGNKVEWSLPPVSGYVNRLVIWEDGSFQTSLIGDFKD